MVGAAPGTQYITIDSLFLTKRWFPVGSENNIIRKKVVPIGFWDMDTNTSVTIVLDTNEINIANVVSLDAVIIRDEVAGAQSISNIVGASGAATNEASAEVSASSSVGSHPYLYSVTVTRLTSGSFDGTAYNDGAINRGFVIIEYIPE